MSVVGKAHKPGEIPVTSDDIKRRFNEYHALYKSLGGKSDMFTGFECKTFPYGSATPPTCPQACMTCTEQFIPTGARDNALSWERVKIHNDAEATSTIQNLIQTTQSDYDFVKSMIQTHGNAIVKRWQKKSVAKREQFLREAVPGILLRRNADIEMVFQGVNYAVDSMNNRVSDEAYQNQQQKPEEPYMTPFLNAESLSEDPMRLLALMHHRAHAQLSEWVSFDREMIQTYFNCGHLCCAYNPRCVVIDGPQFGSLVQWSKDAAHRWQMIGYPLARHLFRVQSMIASFLRKATTALLEYAEDEAPKGRDLWDRLVSISFKHEDCFVAPSAYYSQVFACPPKFDIGYIIKGLEARCNAELDEALLVQADPLYLRRLLDQAQKSAIWAFMPEDHKQRLLYVTTIRSMLNRTHWAYMLSFAKKMSAYSPTEHQGIISLPKDYEKHLRTLEVAVRVHFETLVTELSGFVANSREFRQHFSGNRQITDPEIAYRTDPLFWAVIEVVAQNIETNRPAAWCLSFIEEHLAKASSKECARLDQQLYDQLSDVAFADEIITAIRAHKSYSPYSRSSKQAGPLHERLHTPTINNLMLSLICAGFEDSDVQDALHAFLEAPLPEKASDHEKLKYNIALKKKFDKYWTTLRSKALNSPAFLGRDPDEKFTIEHKFHEYTNGQAYIFDAGQDAIRAAIRKEEQRAQSAKVEVVASVTSDSVSSKAGAAGHQTGREIAKNMESKPKTKTRAKLAGRLANAFASMDIDSSSSAKTATRQNTIGVKNKSISFFKQMFSSAEAPQRSLKWVDLLDALVDAGMSATHSGGSKVTFEDMRTGKGSIVLHKPHPDPTVHHVMLKTVGRRLAKWFGWGEKTFVAREKKDKE